MKKIISMLLCIAMLVSMFGCTDTKRDPTASENEKITEIFSNLCEYYNIEDIPLPTIKITSKARVEKLSGQSLSNAMYYDKDKTVYLVDMDSEYSVALIAHELVHYLNHYLSGFSEFYGFDYIIGNTYDCGYFLTEGITQFISSQVYPMPAEYTAYPFEAMLAELLASIIGEAELIESFLTSDIDTIKDAFNKLAYRADYIDQTTDTNVEMTPFDFFTFFLDTYSNAFYSGNVLLYQQYASATLSIVQTMAKEAHKTSKSNNILEAFLEKYGGTFGFLRAI